jgi:hypothetical protein
MEIEVYGFPPLRQEKGARMGHGGFKFHNFTLVLHTHTFHTLPSADPLKKPLKKKKRVIGFWSGRDSKSRLPAGPWSGSR